MLDLPPSPSQGSDDTGAHRREGEWTLQSLGTYLQSIPTKKDFEGYVTRLEESYKQEIRVLKHDIQDIGVRVDEIERRTNDLSACARDHHSAIQFLLHREEEHSMLMDDIENRNRRNNIRIRGIPESVATKDLDPTLQRLFAAILEVSTPTPIELDRAHRSLGPRPSDADRPRDIICRVHYYRQKEAIMLAMRSRNSIDFEGHPVSILQDLSRRTLQLRRALRPLLEALRERNILYRWGYPFALTARKENKSASFRGLGDLPHFLSTFELPVISLPDWPKSPTLLDPPRFEPWQDVSKRRKKSSPARSTASSSASGT